MADYRHDLQFGVFITPVAAQARVVLELSRLADAVGLDLVTFQDHPYQPSFLDTWTLLSVVAAETTNVRVAPNVANLPLRPPVVLARSAASLDILSGGRVELGLGSGAFWEGIAAVGGPRLDAGPGRRRAERGDRRHPRDLGRRRAVASAIEGELLQVDGAQARTGARARHGDLARRLQAADAAAHRREGQRVAAVARLSRARPARRHERDDRRGGGQGRPPARRTIRRLFNVNGSFGYGDGFLQGTPGSGPISSPS